jgi:hypothetical protein
MREMPGVQIDFATSINVRKSPTFIVKNNHMQEVIGP